MAFTAVREQRDKNLENSPINLENVLFSVQQHLQMQDPSPSSHYSCTWKRCKGSHKKDCDEKQPQEPLLLVLGLFRAHTLHCKGSSPSGG